MTRMGKVLTFCLLAFAGTALGAQTGYVVVVNDLNPTSSMARADLAKLFVKKTTKWDSGLKVQPVDQSSSRSVREAFSQGVHGKSVSAIKGYWQRLIFSGRATPPLEVQSDQAVLEYVGSNSGGVGYVSAEVTLGRGVKRLRVTE